MTRTSDFLVIGAGIVGLATALDLQARGGSVTVLEREDTPARHQTGRNSGVIHAGVYYAPGSHKARLCREGVAATESFCAEHGIPYETCGKLIVATDEKEAARLDRLEERSRLNGIQIERVTADDIRRLEPHIEGVAGLLSPSTGIVDYGRMARTMADLFVARGGRLETGARVTGGQIRSDRVTVTTTGDSYDAGALVACAGLQSDRIIRAFGLDPGFRVVPFRGEYFRILNQPEDLVRHLIYPVPDPERPFLGVHLTRKMGGGFTVGPNAVLAFDREGYDSRRPSLSDTAETFGYPGFWRMLAGNAGAAATELADSLSKRRYLGRVHKYCKRVELGDLAPLPPGIRAQAVAPDGKIIDDFLFVEADRALFVGNAPSPAATSAIPIAGEIVTRLGL